MSISKGIRMSISNLKITNILPLAVAFTLVFPNLTGCAAGDKVGKAIDNMMEPEIPLESINEEDMYAPEILNEEFLAEIMMFKEHLDILSIIYEDKNLDLSQARQLQEELDVSKVNVENMQDFLDNANLEVGSEFDRDLYDKKCKALDTILTIQTSLEDELLTDDGYDKIEAKLTRTIQIEVANALRCRPSDVVIEKRTDTDDCYVTVNEKRFVIRQGHAPYTYKALMALYDHQRDEESLENSSSAEKTARYTKIFKTIAYALSEGLVLYNGEELKAGNKVGFYISLLVNLGRKDSKVYVHK